MLNIKKLERFAHLSKKCFEDFHSEFAHIETSKDEVFNAHQILSDMRFFGEMNTWWNKNTEGILRNVTFCYDF